MPDPVLDFNIKGLDELQAGLKAAQRDLAREERRSNREVAAKVADWSQSAAGSGTPKQRRYAGAIRPRATAKSARIAVVTGGSNAGANTAFFGTKRRTGWYAAARYAGSAGRQHPEWVGARWTAGQFGEGPYVINPTIATHQDQIEELILDGKDRALRSAFPDGGVR